MSRLDSLVKVVREKLSLDVIEIGLDTHFFRELKADSVNHLSLISAIENEYGVEVKDEEYEKLNSLNEIIDFLQSKGVALQPNS
ncbi:MAG: acyl carrier protein [Gammaproteobacteria bacterium]|nr:acyl carrier protein [Gammaproteobacteria bacterium]